MEPIHVPGPPKTAFNKDRRISDLIRAQTAHLKHLEDKLPAAVRAKLPQHGITTEQDAAVYIAAMTNLLRGQDAAPIAVAPTPITAGKPSAAARASETLALAASAEGSPATGNGSSGTKAKKTVGAKKGKR